MTFFETLKWYTLLLLIFFPKIVISPIPGLSSAMRIDIFLALIYVFIWIITILTRRNFFKKNSIILTVLLSLIFAYIFNSNNFVVATGQLLLYISLVGAFIHGASIFGNENLKKIKTLYHLLYANIFIHILFYALGIETYSGIYVGDSGFDENYYILGLYGISSMPFQFAIYIAAFVLILIHGNITHRNYLVIGSLVACTALLTSDSRISLVALVLAVFGLWTILVSPLLFLISSFIQTKSISILSNFGDISADPSLAMRLLNVQNYLDWLSLKNLVFGGGAQSFLEFSEQYGLPGPLDMGYVRLLSEFGLLGLLLIITTLILSIKKRFSIKQTGLGVALIFCAVYSIFNEGLLATRSGHLMMLTVGLLYFKPSGIRLYSPSKNPMKLNREM